MADLTGHQIILTAFDRSTGILRVTFTIDGANSQSIEIPQDQDTDWTSVRNYIRQYSSAWLDGQAQIAAAASTLDLTSFIGTAV
jgi:hypothetical protein